MRRRVTLPLIQKHTTHREELTTKATGQVTARQPKCILVVPGGRPEILSGDPWNVAKEHIASTLSVCRYPHQYKRTDRLRLLLDDNGIYRATAYNRWGIVGPFVIYRLSLNGRHQSLPQALLDDVVQDLEDVDGGLLDPMSGILCPFVEPFARYGIPPTGWVPPAGKWFGG